VKTNRPEPPAYLFVCLLLGVGLHFVVPIVQLVRFPYRLGGILLLGVGIWLNIWADNLFKKAETTVKPFEESSALIVEGPFGASRHPMYLGMALALLGVGLLLGSLVALLVPFAFIAAMEIAFIKHEERALETTFGEEYNRYRRQVRRWL